MRAKARKGCKNEKFDFTDNCPANSAGSRSAGNTGACVRTAQTALYCSRCMYGAVRGFGGIGALRRGKRYAGFIPAN